MDRIIIFLARQGLSGIVRVYSVRAKVIRVIGTPNPIIGQAFKIGLCTFRHEVILLVQYIQVPFLQGHIGIPHIGRNTSSGSFYHYFRYHTVYPYLERVSYGCCLVGIQCQFFIRTVAQGRFQATFRVGHDK